MSLDLPMIFIVEIDEFCHNTVTIPYGFPFDKSSFFSSVVCTDFVVDFFISCGPTVFSDT